MHQMFKGFAASIIALGLATTAHAETKPTTPAPEPAAKVKQVKETKYCVVEVPTGTRIPRKDCRTRAEWMSEGYDPLDQN
ncbi:MAG: hypothetical protein CVT77_13720 [Alphaproteobacteria bacterium HGW-Alphaproteobacteria-16]|nr:MAG: hypothetical protein CVT77_13720 [Alphaproteobacteria bacterium HGW-Alphaproteobacteria-16]